MLSVAGHNEPPLWFVGHGDLTNTTARGQNETANFYTQVNASTHAGFNLVEILVDQWERADTRSGVSNKTTQSIDGILALNPNAMIILRPSILPAVEPSVVMCKENSSATTPSGLSSSTILPVFFCSPPFSVIPCFHKRQSLPQSRWLSERRKLGRKSC